VTAPHLTVASTLNRLLAHPRAGPFGSVKLSPGDLGTYILTPAVHLLMQGGETSLARSVELIIFLITTRATLRLSMSANFASSERCNVTLSDNLYSLERYE